jgi:sulfur carrier protein ThiS adenylyltransferase
METLEQDLIKKVGKEALEKIKKTRVGLAGAGGLGSNCALNLARVGFRKLTIVDFDKVTEANLDRQFYFMDQVGLSKVVALKDNLTRINPDLELKIIQEKINKDNVGALFGDCDIVVECLDQAESKSMLVSELLRMDKFVVAASGLGGVGASDNLKVHRVKKNLVIIGDLNSDIASMPALSPRVNIVAAKQADTVLDYVIEK